MTKRHYLPRLSKKAVLAYLKDVYPEWKTFPEIFEEIPIIRVDTINLSCMLSDLVDRGMIEIEKEEHSLACYRLATKGGE